MYVACCPHLHIFIFAQCILLIVAINHMFDLRRPARINLWPRSCKCASNTKDIIVERSFKNKLSVTVAAAASRSCINYSSFVLPSLSLAPLLSRSHIIAMCFFTFWTSLSDERGIGLSVTSLAFFDNLVRRRCVTEASTISSQPCKYIGTSIAIIGAW